MGQTVSFAFCQFKAGKTQFIMNAIQRENIYRVEKRREQNKTNWIANGSVRPTVSVSVSGSFMVASKR